MPVELNTPSAVADTPLQKGNIEQLISTNLLLYTDDIAAVGDGYRKYWFDNFVDFAKGLPEGPIFLLAKQMQIIGGLYMFLQFPERHELIKLKQGVHRDIFSGNATLLNRC